MKQSPQVRYQRAKIVKSSRKIARHCCRRSRPNSCQLYVCLEISAAEKAQSALHYTNRLTKNSVLTFPHFSRRNILSIITYLVHISGPLFSGGHKRMRTSLILVFHICLHPTNALDILWDLYVGRVYLACRNGFSFTYPQICNAMKSLMRAKCHSSSKSNQYS